MSDHPVNTIMNWASAISVIGTLVGWLPQITAGVALIWYCILIYEYLRGRGHKSG